MKKELFKYLKQNFSQSPTDIDRLFISAFLTVNKLTVEHNELVKQYTIQDLGDEKQKLSEFIEVLMESVEDFSIETLISLFEFVISPSERIVTGAVYTPEYIREYIVKMALNRYTGDLYTIKSCDIACGCGSFLLTLTQQLRRLTEKSLSDIYAENIFGIDVADYSVVRTKLLLSIYAIVYGEDRKSFTFNLFTGNSLIFNWDEECQSVSKNNGFDLIVGNPPYVCSRNMDSETIEMLKNWSVSNTGHPDLYIPFFQIALENLRPGGSLGYITVNTFIKSINGRALRAYFSERRLALTILNFGGEQVFEDRNTYTCVCFIVNAPGTVHYLRTTSDQLQNTGLETLLEFPYEDLADHDGWNLVNDVETSEFITLIEKAGTPFKEIYNTKNGIATLKNDVFKFRPIKEDSNYYYLESHENVYPIERKICRDIVNANKLRIAEDIDRLREKIIFPYDEHTVIIPEGKMKKDFPLAFAYLATKEKELAGRDKGNREYETWYAYGRRQSMDINAYKLFFPHICERPSFVICEEKTLLFYNGLAIVSDNLEELHYIKKIMESEIFFKYISNTTKDYSSGYISMSRNYLKNFGIPSITGEDRVLFLKQEKIEDWLAEIYGLDATLLTTV
jgi:adenine-specific DNA-methyltransferase